MLEHILKTANLSINPTLFLIGLGVIYLTGILLLIAVALKFWEHAKHRQTLDKETKHFFSYEIAIYVKLPLLGIVEIAMI